MQAVELLKTPRLEGGSEDQLSLNFHMQVRGTVSPLVRDLCGSISMHVGALFHAEPMFQGLVFAMRENGMVI